MNTIRVPVPPTYVDLIDEGQLAAVFKADGEYEAKTLERWAKIVKRGTNVVDVGAHTGLFSIAAAKLGARAIAFEPIKFIADIMRRNAALNGVKITIHEAAASDRDGLADIGFRTDIEIPYGGSLMRADKADYKCVKVRTVTIDSLDISKVSAIKIDVERAERFVLDGARRTIERCRPVIILEALNDRAVRKTSARLVKTHRLSRHLDCRNLLFVPL